MGLQSALERVDSGSFLGATSRTSTPHFSGQEVGLLPALPFQEAVVGELRNAKESAREAPDTARQSSFFGEGQAGASALKDLGRFPLGHSSVHFTPPSPLSPLP